MPAATNGPHHGLDVGIIGGSIAGCGAAIELSRLGCNVTLLERSGEELKDRGAGIGIPPSVVDTFISRDLVDHDIPFFPANHFSRIWRTDAHQPYGYLAWEQPAQLAALNWGVLYRNLRDRVPDSQYRNQHRVLELKQRGTDKVRLKLAGGVTEEFDLVVCADGYASLGRNTLFPEIDIAYAGYVLWRGYLLESELGESPPLEHGIRCLGYPGGHGIFYFVPGPGGSVAPGERLVNWGMYVPVVAHELATFMTDKAGEAHEGSLAPGAIPLATQTALKRAAQTRIPDYYADIVERSQDTSVYAIYDCEVPAYRKGRICLIGDAGAFARPHSAAGALKGINDAVALSEALAQHDGVDQALATWDLERTTINNQLVRFGNQLGAALVKEIPDWSTMDATSMEKWFASIVTIKTEYLSARA